MTTVESCLTRVHSSVDM